MLDGMRHQLADSVRGMDSVLQAIDQMGLVRYLPITMYALFYPKQTFRVLIQSRVAYITFPLAWYLISAQISPTPESETSRHLTLYTSAMKRLQAQYEGTDHVLGCLNTIVSQLQFQLLSRRSTTDEMTYPLRSDQNCHSLRQSCKTLDLSDVALFQPKKYLLITCSIDSSLSKGCLPDDSALQNLRTVIYLPLSTTEYQSPDMFSDYQQNSTLPDDFALYDLALQLGLTPANLDCSLEEAPDTDSTHAGSRQMALPGPCGYQEVPSLALDTVGECLSPTN
jgi:hypothetical protein